MNNTNITIRYLTDLEVNEVEECTHLLFGQVMHSYMQKSMGVFKKFKVHPGQAFLLNILNEKNGKSQKELAERLGVKPPSITVMLKKLEQEKYIEKIQDEKDQRLTRIYITDSGRELAKMVTHALREMEKQAFSNMTELEVMFLRRLLLQMKENLKNMTERKDI